MRDPTIEAARLCGVQGGKKKMVDQSWKRGLFMGEVVVGVGERGGFGRKGK